MKTWAGAPVLRKLHKWLQSFFSERGGRLTTRSLLSGAQWCLVIINQKNRTNSGGQTMQLLSNKNLSRNLASRVAERLLFVSLWLSWKRWQLWKLNIRLSRLSFSSQHIFLITTRANIHSGNALIPGRIEMVSLPSMPFKIMLIHWDSHS